MNIPPFFAAPLSAGLVTYREMRDDLTIDEVADLNEVLIVRGENERRASQAAETAGRNRRK